MRLYLIQHFTSDEFTYDANETQGVFLDIDIAVDAAKKYVKSLDSEYKEVESDQYYWLAETEDQQNLVYIFETQSGILF